MTIVYCGGGTGGSVTPLLAIAKHLEKYLPKTDKVFIGTNQGPEKELSKSLGFRYVAIDAGKLRRYFDWRNIVDPLRVLHGFFQALVILRRSRPSIVISAGSFVSVPVVWAAWLLGIPSVAHQPDVNVGLSNQLIRPFVSRLTVGFESTLKQIHSPKAYLTGNPIRPDILLGSAEHALGLFELKRKVKTILVMGGGTGALRLNQLVASAALRLVNFYQIIHLTGRGKGRFGIMHPNYHPYEFLVDEQKHALAIADLVISRAGISTLSELAALGKAVILVPLPDSHQETNAEFFNKAKAALVLNENTLTDQELVDQIHGLLSDSEKLDELRRNIKRIGQVDALENISRIILGLIKK